MGFWQRLFGQTSLASIDKPTRAKVQGRIVSTNDAIGLMSGLRGALIELQLSARYYPTRRTRYGDEVQDEEPRFEVIGTVLTANSIVVRCEGGDLLVPPRNASMRFAGNDHGVPIDRPIPPEVAAFLHSPSAQGRVVFYRELAVSQGDLVRVEATIAPSDAMEASEAGYRETATTRTWAARPDLGSIVIEDRSLEG